MPPVPLHYIRGRCGGSGGGALRKRISQWRRPGTEPISQSCVEPGVGPSQKPYPVCSSSPRSRPLGASFPFLPFPPLLILPRNCTTTTLGDCVPFHGERVDCIALHCSNGDDIRSPDAAVRLHLFTNQLLHQSLLQRPQGLTLLRHQEGSLKEFIAMPGAFQGLQGGGHGGDIARADIRGGSRRGSGDGASDS